MWFEPENRLSFTPQLPKEDEGTRDLVGGANQNVDDKEMAKAKAKLRKGDFTLDDFKKQLRQVAKLGQIQKVMSMIPGMRGLAEMAGNRNAATEMLRLIGIIDSMTPDERHAPTMTVDENRRLRIAAGAGVKPHDVSELIRQFDTMSSLMKESCEHEPHSTHEIRCTGGEESARRRSDK